MSIKKQSMKANKPRASRYSKEDFKNIAVMNILAKEWMDKNNNTYFSVRVRLYSRGSCSKCGESCIYIPKTYGYHNAYEEAVAKVIGEDPWLLHAKYGFILISNKVSVRTLSEVIEWGQE